jgi:2OG-Fe(II) oxygenase superfamily
MDYLDNNAGTEAYDYSSGGKGGYRFATILLYMSDLPENAGGETVFTKSYPPGKPEIPLEVALRQLRESDDAGLLKQGSWEEQMVAQCRTRLAVRPNTSRAVLFYSQHPNGAEDETSEHGGCPVLNGTKVRQGALSGLARVAFDSDCILKLFSVVGRQLVGLECTATRVRRSPLEEGY